MPSPGTVELREGLLTTLKDSRPQGSGRAGRVHILRSWAAEVAGCEEPGHLCRHETRLSSTFPMINLYWDALWTWNIQSINYNRIMNGYLHRRYKYWNNVQKEPPCSQDLIFPRCFLWVHLFVGLHCRLQLWTFGRIFVSSSTPLPPCPWFQLLVSVGYNSVLS